MKTFTKKQIEEKMQEIDLGWDNRIYVISKKSFEEEFGNNHQQSPKSELIAGRVSDVKELDVLDKSNSSPADTSNKSLVQGDEI